MKYKCQRSSSCSVTRSKHVQAWQSNSMCIPHIDLYVTQQTMLAMQGGIDSGTTIQFPSRKNHPKQSQIKIRNVVMQNPQKGQCKHTWTRTPSMLTRLPNEEQHARQRPWLTLPTIVLLLQTTSTCPCSCHQWSAKVDSCRLLETLKDFLPLVKHVYITASNRRSWHTHVKAVRGSHTKPNQT
jgi:hypothetical protein